MPYSAHLSPQGSFPTLVLEIGSVTYCDYLVLYRKPGTSNWIALNKGNNASQSTIIIPLVPPLFPNSLSDFSGWAIGWSAIFVGYTSNSSEPYGLRAEILQKENDVLSPAYYKSGSFDTHTQTVEDGCIFS